MNSCPHGRCGILVVDDDEVLAATLTKLLRQSYPNVHTALSGAEAAATPELFIDAVGSTSWFMRDPKYYGFDQFPEIVDFVKTNYVFLANSYDQRYYLRRDRASVR